MNSFLKKAEQALLPLANTCAPEGTSPSAVAHQWVHAVASNKDVFAGKKVSGKQEVLNLLIKAGLYSDTQSFQDSLYSDTTMKPDVNSRFSFIDLFAGIGGMRIAAQQQGGACVFSSEFDKYAQETYFNNYGEMPFGDIVKISEEDIPDHDLLLAGFPCQPFSIAGISKNNSLDRPHGFRDQTRGTLFFHIARILSAKQPKFAILENVKNIISHDGGRTLHIILRALLEVGYQCTIPDEVILQEDPKLLQHHAKVMVLAASDFGVPQRRHRIYIVAWRKDISSGFAYPKPLNILTRLGDILDSDVDEKFRISDRSWKAHLDRKIRRKAEGKGFGYSLFTKDSPCASTIMARYYKDGSEILIDEENGKNPRRLTPREAARLQGFPEEFIIHSSNTQAYKQFGNSVAIPVVKAIVQRLPFI